jgi:hypothetical protein
MWKMQQDIERRYGIRKRREKSHLKSTGNMMRVKARGNI